MDERDYLSPEALAVLDASRPEVLATGEPVPLWQRWVAAARPLLSPHGLRAKRVMEAVAKEAAWCEMHCDEKNDCAQEWADREDPYPCLLHAIRRAYLGDGESESTTKEDPDA